MHGLSRRRSAGIDVTPAMQPRLVIVPGSSLTNDSSGGYSVTSDSHLEWNPQVMLDLLSRGAGVLQRAPSPIVDG